MLIRSILTIAVLGAFVFGAAAQAGHVGAGPQEPAPRTEGVAPHGTPWGSVRR